MSIPRLFKKHWLATGAYAAVGAGLFLTWLDNRDVEFETATHDRNDAQEFIDSLPLNAEPRLSFVFETGVDTAAPPKAHLTFSEAFNTPALMGLPPKPAQDVLDEFSYQDGDILLNPYLVKALEDDPKAREYLRMIRDVAQSYDLDWRMAANQIFRESLHFNEDVISGKENSNKGAVGIAQFMPVTAAEYGFMADEMTNPQTALSLYALHMTNLKEKHDGDVILALMEYNAGAGAIYWAREELQNTEANGEEIMAFLDARYETLGNTDPHAYHVETRAYIHEILDTDPSGAESPRWMINQNQRLNDPYFVAGLLNESHIIKNMFPVYEPPIVDMADGSGMTSSLRPKPRPPKIELAQN